MHTGQDFRVQMYTIWDCDSLMISGEYAKQAAKVVMNDEIITSMCDQNKKITGSIFKT